MSRQIYNMRVTKIIDHTPTVRELLLLNESEQDFSYRAGQFAMLHVPVPESKPALRAYSIASDDRVKNEMRLLFRYVDNGVASKYVWSLKGQELLQFTGPFGRVFFQEPPPVQNLFLSTGTGISQHLCYIYSKIEQYPNIKWHILFGLRSESDIYIQNELDQLTEKYSNFDYDIVLSRPSEYWSGKQGYVQNFLFDFDIKTDTCVYLCGNGGMIKEVKHLLAETGFPSQRIWSEAFD
jgi:CDP-4-dehydro-6-deoxyglucose reductase, E3